MNCEILSDPDDNVTDRARNAGVLIASGVVQR
jgi:hypothetical protein